MPKFSIGDSIQNQKPYDGEPEKMVVEIDDYGYKLINVEENPSTNGRECMPFDHEDSYRKVG